MALNKFFRFPFARSGDKAAVPDAVVPGGDVSYDQGYGPDYQLPPANPTSKDIERDKMNQILFDITTALNEYQSNGIPDWISNAQNGGVAFPYPAGARVRYTDGFTYLSLVAANTGLPTGAQWQRIDVGRLLQIQTFTSSGTYTPSPGVRTILVEAIGGGGAGGGAAASAAGEVRCGSGGAGGSYARVFAAVPGAPAAVTVGAPGIAVTGGVGGAGGTTSVAGVVSCPGGGGGQSAATVTSGFSQAPQSAPGAAPTVSTGATLVAAPGQPGLLGWLNSGIICSGQGAPSQFGGGGPNTNSGNGGVSNAKGAGGGGGASASSTGPFPGGNGGPGLVIITEFS